MDAQVPPGLTRENEGHDFHTAAHIRITPWFFRGVKILHHWCSFELVQNMEIWLLAPKN